MIYISNWSFSLYSFIFAKNAILIVEFAMQAQEKGKTILEATLEAARLVLDL